MGVEPSLIGEANRHAAVLGALPDPQSTTDEVRSFVAGLVRQGAIAYDEPARKAAARRSTRRGRGAVTGKDAAPTHAVVREQGRLVLRRVRYACACCAGAEV